MSDIKSEAKDFSHFTFFENFKKGKIFTEAQIKDIFLEDTDDIFDIHFEVNKV